MFQANGKDSHYIVTHPVSEWPTNKELPGNNGGFVAVMH
jgi:hypothetical protein